MDQSSTIKKYPASTAEVSKMLGITNPKQDLPLGTVPLGDLPVANLPVAPSETPEVKHSSVGYNPSSGHAEIIPSASGKGKTKAAFALKTAKAIAPYAVVFTVGMFLYFFFFTSFDFSSVFSTTPAASTPQQSALQQLETQDMASYNTWINGFYYNVTDPKIVAPDSDNSGNGLSNFQKYLLNLNPKSYDTLGLGMPDSEIISNGISPLTDAPLTDDQKTIINKYIDMEVVMDRLALSTMQNPGQVAGASIGIRGEPVVGTGSAASGGAQYGSDFAPSSGVASNPVLSPSAPDNSVNINTAIPGKLEIPDLKITVPIIWTQSTNDFEQDLQVGVVHYPGTAMPGQVGTTYIAGHSSNYIWAKGSYNRIFSTLGKLANNTSFSITVTEINGKTAIFHYVVVKSQQYSPTDQAQFQNTGQSLVALSTCWPVNSTAKRLVVFGQLTQVEQ